MTSADIRFALRARYDDRRRYAIAEEVGLTTGFSHRRLDMMVMDCYNSNGFRIDGFEIKISAADLRRELEDPEKHVAFYDTLDYFTLAVPNGLTEKLMDVIPLKWGVLFVNEDGSTRYKRRALALRDEKADRSVPRGFFASVVRSIQQYKPSTEELQKEYARGVEDGKSDAFQYAETMAGRIKREAEKIEAYDKLQQRLHVYGDAEKIKEALDDYDAFRKLDKDYVLWTIKNAMDSLSKMSDLLKGDAKA